MFVEKPERLNNRPFFSDPRTKKFVSDVADVEALTIVVGAGASVSSGIDGWHGILLSLLKDLGRKMGLDQAAGAAFSQRILTTHDPLAAASIIQSSFDGITMRDKLRQALYSEFVHVDGRPLQPSDLHYQLTNFPLVWDNCRVVTTNFDELLEVAFTERLGRGVAEPNTSEHPAADPVLQPITHLHGYLPFDGDPSGEIILGERDFFAANSAAWIEEQLDDAFRGRSCLFVGLSLSDPNLIGYMHRAQERSPGSTHFAILPNPIDSTVGAEEWELERHIVRARDHRLRSLGISVVRPDFYAQPQQLLAEIFDYRLIRGAADNAESYSHFSERYGQRLTAWFRELRSTGFTTTDLSTFIATQTRCGEHLRTAVSNVESIYRGLTYDDKLGSHLWLRNPHTLALDLWGSSSRTCVEPEAMLSAPIEHKSPYRALEAYTRGVPVVEQNRGGDSRWKWVQSFPVELPADSAFGRMPVGVITLDSTLDVPVFSRPEAQPLIAEVQQALVGNALRAIGVAQGP